ncbi:hypothetical protein [Herbiconiux sp. L3-i23]|uniref:hypothetical protein n=1 Tax=Herbiconiux sp. L3-i23 TaxID=2905871 RepID=UPI00205D1F0A|nr:hypothetical protein [Herbiconiux sp. L3-i23]BDI23889.1 hypothetical protein L3i23_26650 [Herbiconiux sp. L3-i23]
MTGERTQQLQRSRMRKALRDAERAGRAVARRDSRLRVAPSAIAEQIPAIALAATAAAAAEPRNHRERKRAAVGSRRTPATVRLGSVIAAVLAVAVLGTGLTATDVQRTAAWFTAKQETVANQVTSAVVKVGGVGPDLDPTAKLQVANILPMTSDAALAQNKAQSLDLVVRNTGSVPINWTLSLKDVAKTGGAVDLGAITNVSYRIGTGAWSAPTKLASLAPVSGQNLPSTTGSNRVTVTVRFWFDPTVTNEAQGATAQFTTLLEAIQTGAS